MSVFSRFVPHNKVNSLHAVSRFWPPPWMVATKHGRELAALHQWRKERTDKVLKSIKFKYDSSIIYNSYARYTSKEVKQLIGVLAISSKSATGFSAMILTNPVLQHNLDGYVEGVIGEKYITAKYAPIWPRDLRALHVIKTPAFGKYASSGSVTQPDSFLLHPKNTS